MLTIYCNYNLSRSDEFNICNGIKRADVTTISITNATSVIIDTVFKNKCVKCVHITNLTEPVIVCPKIQNDNITTMKLTNCVIYDLTLLKKLTQLFAIDCYNKITKINTNTRISWIAQSYYRLQKPPTMTNIENNITKVINYRTDEIIKNIAKYENLEEISLKKFRNLINANIENLKTKHTIVYVDPSTIKLKSLPSFKCCTLDLRSENDIFVHKCIKMLNKKKLKNVFEIYANDISDINFKKTNISRILCFREINMSSTLECLINCSMRDLLNMKSKTLNYLELVNTGFFDNQSYHEYYEQQLSDADKKNEIFNKIFMNNINLQYIKYGNETYYRYNNTFISMYHNLFIHKSFANDTITRMTYNLSLIPINNDIRMFAIKLYL
jgi:hypothetical protein